MKCKCDCEVGAIRTNPDKYKINNYKATFPLSISLA